MSDQPKIATLADFQKLVPCKTQHFDSKVFGRVLVRQLSRSDNNRLDAWLKPEGKLSKEREALRDLKIVSLSVVDESGNLVFDFADTKDGNDAFFEFAKSIEGSAAEPWDELIYEVMVLQGYFRKVDSLLGK